MRALQSLALTVLMLLGSVAFASIDVYEFDSPEKEARFRTLASELRCPKCQNQNVNDSNAPLAKDIKDRVVTLIDEGKSDQEIVDYMVERYGEFVTYRPRMSFGVALLWGVPAGIGIIVLIGLLLSRRKTTKAPTSDTAVDQQRIQSLLDQYTEKTKP